MIQPDDGEQFEHDLYCSGCGERLGQLTLDSPAALLERWSWDEHAATALARAGNRATALLLVELDEITWISERHGSGAAGAALRVAATILRDTLRTTDIAGRNTNPGGGEFLVLLPARDRQLGEMIARRIRARIRRAIIPARSATGEPVVLDNLAVSVGVAVSDPSTGRSLPLAELLRQADAALLQAKTAGGDQIVVAGGGMRLTNR